MWLCGVAKDLGGKAYEVLVGGVGVDHIGYDTHEIPLHRRRVVPLARAGASAGGLSLLVEKAERFCEERARLVGQHCCLRGCES